MEGEDAAQEAGEGLMAGLVVIEEARAVAAKMRLLSLGVLL